MQVMPDAGSLLRNQPKPPAVDQEGPRVLVRSFRIVGATRIPETERLGELASLVRDRKNQSPLVTGLLRRSPLFPRSRGVCSGHNDAYVSSRPAISEKPHGNPRLSITASQVRSVRSHLGFGRE